MKIGDWTVKSFMTTPVKGLSPSDSIGQCREAMDLISVRHVPVVDAHNHVIGIVSNQDLHRATQMGCGRIADIPLRVVCTVRPTTPVLEAIESMIEHGFGSLAVVGPNEQLVGMLTEADVLAIARRALLLAAKIGGSSAQALDHRLDAAKVIDTALLCAE